MRKNPKGKNLSSWAGLILCLLIGFVFVCIGTGVEPVEREELQEVQIRFDCYKLIAMDVSDIRIFDGSGESYQLHTANADHTLVEKLMEVPTGAELQLLLHPEDGYVMGIYRDGTPLLSWQAAQEEIADEDLGFSWLGYGMWGMGIVMFVTEIFAKKKK